MVAVVVVRMVAEAVAEVATTETRFAADGYRTYAARGSAHVRISTSMVLSIYRSQR